MSNRENDIKRAIENLDGTPFERFSRILAKWEKFPGLRPTSQSHDKGEDAYTEDTSIFLHNGKRISLGASKTDELWKIKEKSHGSNASSYGMRVLTLEYLGRNLELYDKESSKSKRWARLIH